MIVVVVVLVLTVGNFLGSGENTLPLAIALGSFDTGDGTLELRDVCDVGVASAFIQIDGIDCAWRSIIAQKYGEME